MNNAGLYIHIPFCVKKCAYCDFISYAGRSGEMEAYIEALIREMHTRKDIRAFDTVYIGGGTPSLLPEEAVSRLLAEVRACYTIAQNAEITVEANPNSLTKRKLEEYLRAGVNRVSLGVQSQSDALLQTLGRAHMARDARAAMWLLRESGVSWSADAMLSLPGQSVCDVESTLAELFAYAPWHISAYPLILEEGTPLKSAVAKGKLALPSEDEAYALEMRAVELLKAAGYARYEVSSFAKPGMESRHNLNYWNNGAYLGLGAAAHGAYRAYNGVWIRTENTPDLAAYIAGAKPKETPIPRDEEMFETVMLGLRMVRGIDLRAFKERFGVRFEEHYAAHVEILQREGLMELHEGYSALMPRGMELQNRVLLGFMEA